MEHPVTYLQPYIFWNSTSSFIWCYQIKNECAWYYVQKFCGTKLLYSIIFRPSSQLVPLFCPRYGWLHPHCSWLHPYYGWLCTYYSWPRPFHSWLQLNLAQRTEMNSCLIFFSLLHLYLATVWSVCFRWENLSLLKDISCLRHQRTVECISPSIWRGGVWLQLRVRYLWPSFPVAFHH